MILNRNFRTALGTILAIVVGLLPVDGLLQSSSARTTDTNSGQIFESISKELNTASKKKKKKRTTRRTQTTRRYTVRGNPEVTRKVATELIGEKLPELANLIGISSGDMISETATDGGTGHIPTAGLDAPGFSAKAAAPQPKGPSSDYDDSELSDEEDSDALSSDDIDMLEEDDELTIDEFYKDFTTYMAGLNGESFVTYNGVDKVQAMESIVDWLGTRYLFGGNGRSGIDCSAYTRMIYRELGYQLPRTAAAQWDASDDEITFEELQFGDLVFFNTRSAVYVSHVGMYLGNGMFTHASSRNGVTVSSLESNYYSTHFIGARRYDVAGAMAGGEGEMAMSND